MEDGENWDAERVDAIAFERLEKDPNAPLAVALMVAANDLFFDFNGLQCYLDHLPEDKYAGFLRQAAVVYHERLICSRMLETLDLVQKIADNEYFLSILEKNQEVLAAFHRLLAYKKGGQFSEEHQRLERIRNNGSFHYESLEKLFRQLFKEKYKPYKGNYGLAVLFPENKIFFQRFFIADTLLSALMVSKIFPAPDARPKTDENLRRDYDKLPEAIKEFGMDFYAVVMTVLNQFVYDLQQPEVEQSKGT